MHAEIAAPKRRGRPQGALQPVLCGLPGARGWARAQVNVTSDFRDALRSRAAWGGDRACWAPCFAYLRLSRDGPPIVELVGKRSGRECRSAPPGSEVWLLVSGAQDAE